MPRLFDQLGRGFKTIQKKFLETEKRCRGSKTRTVRDDAYVQARAAYIAALKRNGLSNKDVGRLVDFPIETEQTRLAKQKAEQSWLKMNGQRYTIKDGVKLENTIAFQNAYHERQLALRLKYLLKAGKEYVDACTHLETCIAKLQVMDKNYQAFPALLINLNHELCGHYWVCALMLQGLDGLNTLRSISGFPTPAYLLEQCHLITQNLSHVQLLIKGNLNQQRLIKTAQASYHTDRVAYEDASKTLKAKRHEAIRNLINEEHLYAARLGVDDAQLAEEDLGQDVHSAKRTKPF